MFSEIVAWVAMLGSALFLMTAFAVIVYLYTSNDTYAKLWRIGGTIKWTQILIGLGVFAASGIYLWG